MEGIKRACEKHLLTRGTFNLRLIVLAETYKLLRLKKSAVKYVWKHLSFHEILDNEIFKTMEASTRSEILEKRIRDVFGRLPDDVGKLLSVFPEIKSPPRPNLATKMGGMTMGVDEHRDVAVRQFTQCLASRCNLRKNIGDNTYPSLERKSQPNYAPIKIDPW